MRLFGENHYGIVMASVVLGTLSLPLVFLLGRELGGAILGFMAAGLLAISYTHIHFSRILFGNSASFAALVLTYALFRGLRTRETFWFALSGVFVGLGLLLYDSSRVVPLILLSVMLWQWLWQHQTFKLLFKNWLVLGAGAVVAFGPMLAFAVLNFSIFAGRANVVTLWTPDVWRHEVASYETSSGFVVIVQQIWRTFLTLHLSGDSSPHFAFPRPMVSSVTALFFILGLGYAIFRMKEIKHFTLHVWIFLTFIFGGVLTADPPYWPHLNIALPPIVLVAAVGIESFAVTLKNVFGRIGYKVTIWVMIGILLVTGINNWQVYYDYVKNNAGNRTRIARYLSSLPLSYYVYMVSDQFSWGEYAFQFFSQGTRGQDLTIDMLESEAPALDRPTVFILFQHPEMIPVLQRLYPDGEVENHYNYNNLVSFISYRVVPATADVSPDSAEVSQLSSPGWQLLFGLVVFWIGYVAYAYYSAQETAAVKNQPIDDLRLE
jgi:4-amino-4-deoxy-L-arabinose transferase-like glycosyltransferase